MKIIRPCFLRPLHINPIEKFNFSIHKKSLYTKVEKIDKAMLTKIDQTIKDLNGKGPEALRTPYVNKARAVAQFTARW